MLELSCVRLTYWSLCKTFIFSGNMQYASSITQIATF